ERTGTPRVVYRIAGGDCMRFRRYSYTTHARFRLLRLQLLPFAYSVAPFVCSASDDGRSMARGNSAGSQTTKATLGLRELVFSGAVGPGERLPEVELAERLGVSRTPLRLALMTLAHEGLLEALSGGGFAVRAFSRADVSDAIELRGVREGTAAAFAAAPLE